MSQLTWPMVVDQCSSKFNEIASQNKLVTWAEESQFANQAIAGNKTLSQCSVDTIQNSIINVAAIGLTLNPAMGYAYLVPEKGSCNLKVSFKGLLKIANESGSIVWAKAEIVRQNDVFTYKGPCDKPTHEINPFSSDRGPTVGVYCIAKTFDGEYLVDLMDSNEINKIKGCAKTKYVWDQWPDEMAKKAIIKRAAKQWPRKDQNARLDTAVNIVNELEGSEAIEKDITPKINPEFIGRFHAAMQQSDGVALVGLMDDIKEETGYTQETYSDFITAQKEIYKTVPRGQKGKTEEAFKTFYNNGISDLSEGATVAVMNYDDQWLAENILALGDSKSDVWARLGDNEKQYIKSMKG